MLDLAKEAEPPAEGKASKIIFEDDRIKSVVYGFRPDQGLSATHLTLSNLRSVKK